MNKALNMVLAGCVLVIGLLVIVIIIKQNQKTTANVAAPGTAQLDKLQSDIHALHIRLSSIERHCAQEISSTRPPFWQPNEISAPTRVTIAGGKWEWRTLEVPPDESSTGTVINRISRWVWIADSLPKAKPELESEK